MTFTELLQAISADMHVDINKAVDSGGCAIRFENNVELNIEYHNDEAYLFSPVMRTASLFKILCKCLSSEVTALTVTSEERHLHKILNRLLKFSTGKSIYPRLSIELHDLQWRKPISAETGINVHDEDFRWRETGCPYADP